MRASRSADIRSLISLGFKRNAKCAPVRSSAAKPLILFISMIVHKHDEPRRGECLSETFKTVFPGSPKAVSHGDSRADTISFGQE